MSFYVVFNSFNNRSANASECEEIMKYVIVTDSGCDLRTLNAKADDTEYTQVPLKINIDGKEYTDTADIDISQMIADMEGFKGKSTSACPSPDDWYNACAQGEYVFAVTITSALSGSYNSAATAKHMYLEEHPDKKICIIDSLSTGPSMTMITEKLNELIKKYDNFDTICTKITEYQKKLKLVFNLLSLDNLVKNGRVSKVVAAISSVLNISIIGKASTEGTLEVTGKARGAKRAYASMVEDLKKTIKGTRIVMCHCMNEEGAGILKRLILEVLPSADISIMPASGLDSFYAQKGGILMGYECI